MRRCTSVRTCAAAEATTGEELLRLTVFFLLAVRRCPAFHRLLPPSPPSPVSKGGARLPSRVRPGEATVAERSVRVAPGVTLTTAAADR